MIDVSELIHDEDFCTEFTVIKKNEPIWERGVAVYEEIKKDVQGIVLPSSSEDIELLPEADRHHGLKSFFTDECELNITDDEKTSDICVYGGKKYKLIHVFDYHKNGYYKAIGTLIGDENEV